MEIIRQKNRTTIILSLMELQKNRIFKCSAIIAICKVISNFFSNNLKSTKMTDEKQTIPEKELNQNANGSENKNNIEDLIDEEEEAIILLDAEHHQNEMAVHQPSVSDALIQQVDLTQDFPDLDEAEVLPFDLMTDYWTPVEVGDSKRLIFDRTEPRPVVDKKTGEVLQLMSAHFYEKKNGVVSSVSNASKKLVNTIIDLQIKRGSALVITYLGKRRNKTNPNSHDSWSVKPLMFVKPSDKQE